MRTAPPSNRPIIGITTGEMHNLDSPTDPWVFGQTHFYSEAVERAGGVPLLIPSTENIETIDALYKVLEGILLAGGNDVDPRLYGEEPHTALEDVSKKRDSTELHLVKCARTDKKPMLAICRGAQLWNIAEGGSLFQHLPDYVDTQIIHANRDKNLKPKLHKVVIEKDSTLAKILLPKRKNMTIGVNSYHHQAINKLGQGLRIVARADDGVIEAIETELKNWFAIGVQWHPESMDKPSSLLFEKFVTESSGYRAK